MAIRRKREWFDDEAFWRELYPFMFTEKRFADTPDQIEKVLALTRPAGRAALDLCCGPGRCSIALARKGFAVTGVDRTRFLLNKARARARVAKVKVEWIGWNWPVSWTCDSTVRWPAMGTDPTPND